MIAYITLGTNDIDRAGKFYDGLLGELGAGRVMENRRLTAWATGPGQPMVAVIKLLDEKAATVENGTMISIGAENPAAVDRLYAKALELGGVDEGAPGVRADMFYIGYFRKIDVISSTFYMNDA